MLLVGDIGGTHARLALVDAQSHQLHAERRTTTADVSEFAAILAAYLAEVDLPITSGCLAVAGPIADDGRTAKLTNLPWNIDAAQLEQRFNIPHIALANDFAAAAIGVTVAPAETIVPLQAGEPQAQAPKLVVGAGTGLGMAVLLWENQRWRILPGEGGHVGFSPLDENQDRVFQALRREHGRVTAERVISGPGLAAIHRILTGTDLAAEDIARLAANEATARQSIDVFLAAYGAFAGDMAMTTLARGGVYLAGGIAGKLLPLLPYSPFLAAFNAKAEHAALVARMPIAVVTDAALGLRGAACLANLHY